jgi:hypothetical protein
MKGQLKSLSQMITAPVPIVSDVNIPTEVVPGLISEKFEFWVKNSITYCPQNMYQNAFFSDNCLLHLLEPVLFYMVVVIAAFCLEHLFKTQLNAFFPPV